MLGHWTADVKKKILTSLLQVMKKGCDIVKVRQKWGHRRAEPPNFTLITSKLKRNFCPPVPIQAGNRTIMIPRERTNL